MARFIERHDSQILGNKILKMSCAGHGQQKGLTCQLKLDTTTAAGSAADMRNQVIATGLVQREFELSPIFLANPISQRILVRKRFISKHDTEDIGGAGRHVDRSVRSLWIRTT